MTWIGTEIKLAKRFIAGTAYNGKIMNKFNAIRNSSIGDFETPWNQLFIATMVFIQIFLYNI
jgi:hypothetical protein